MLLQSASLALPLALVIGLVLFLFGMRQLESGIRILGYDAFKKSLSRSTASPLRSAFSGVVSTAILQSSSLVSLLVLAFASAGALPLFNALGVILGANLGTTVTGWMVATIGFKLSLQLFALPLMALGGLMQLITSRSEKLAAPGMALFGLGMIIFGLDVMKTAVSDLPGHFDIAVLQGLPPLVYLLFGTALAALIQSSSGTMMITLAGLNAGLLDLSAAAALVIGADLGTTSTTMLGSIGGHPVKRQLALGHLVFNLVGALGAFLLLLPVLPAVMGLLSLQDPLYSLVAFHSLFNLIGLLVFLPFLKSFAALMGRFFQQTGDVQEKLSEQLVQVPDAALLAMADVLEGMRANAMVLNLHAFHLGLEDLHLGEDIQEALVGHAGQNIASDQRYNILKQLESEMLAFSLNLQSSKLTQEQAETMAQYVAEARALVYSSKTINDIRRDLVSLRHNPEEGASMVHMAHRKFFRTVCRAYLLRNTSEPRTAASDEGIAQLIKDNEDHFNNANTLVSDMASGQAMASSKLSTMLNVNREIHHAVQNLLAPA
jgi:phosphate:Na+ symporter